MMGSRIAGRPLDRGRRDHAGGLPEPASRRRSINVAASCAAACAGIGLSVVGCASTAPYNPDQLSAAQVTWVGEICRNVLGLSPREPLVWGIHSGVSDLDPWMSHYRGCIASLSNSVRSANAAQAAGQADRECRAKGLEPGTPALAVCVLRSTEAEPDRPAMQAATAATSRGQEPLPPPHAGSFYNAATRTVSRRERLACAAIGFEPATLPFESCVRDLSATFFAIDNPVT